MRILFLWENGKMLRDGKNGKRDEMEEGGRKKNPFFFFSMVRFVLVEKKRRHYQYNPNVRLSVSL